MMRGNQKQCTFLENEDFNKYLELLKHYKNKYHFSLYGYCLMPNHVHLVMEVKKSSTLGKIIQGLNMAYTIWFNKKYNKVGHLWQGRYKNKLIQKDKYLLDCIEYVELNPIRSSIGTSPFDYSWSSWKERMGHKETNLLDIPHLS
jgi:putative transposase